MVKLSYAIAAAMVHGPETGLEMLAEIEGDTRVAEHHRIDAVRAHLLERAGDREKAIVYYRRAAERNGEHSRARLSHDKSCSAGRTEGLRD
jgi:predicted RNA polymerase sigma factor